ncbi:helix-turn-helix transcriptional regulator [Bacillus pumilus]|uniref:helix-turn-helix transcriptional regulator n=1 Tax=Bacillus pumilus TaxID=1408 RepID=UPI0011A2F103|nr:helix-turn-helix transcriptional regulator [Bacillus pumilus]
MLQNRLREIRKDIGMSISELARRTELSRANITNIELHGQEPSGFTMLRIASVLQKDPREIFFEQNETHG